jgi:biopolymer transport protein ExbD
MPQNPLYKIDLLADADDKRRFSALLKVIAVLILKLRGENIKDVKPVSDKYVDDARGFLRSIGMKPNSFNSMYGIILRKPVDVHPAALEFVKELRVKMRAANILNDLDKMSVHQKELVGPLLTLISTPSSASAYSSLLRRVSYLKEPDIQKRFIQNFTNNNEGSQAIHAKLSAAVKKLTGRADSIALTTEENKKFKASAKHAETAAEISKMRSSYSQAVNQEMKQVILNADKKLLPVATVMKALSDEGVKKLPFPDEFRKPQAKNVYVNLDAELTNVEGHPLSLQRVQPGFTVTFNPKYDPKATKGSGNTWLYKWTNPTAGNDGYVYTKDQMATNKSEKFTKLDDVITTGDLEKKKDEWRKSMGTKFDDPNTVFAYLTEYIYATSSRIGSGVAGNTGGKDTYGASNFPVKSVGGLREGGTETKLRISYFVKGGHRESFFLDPSKPDLFESDKAALKKLIKFIDAKCKDKKPSDPVFTVKGKRVSTSDYNAWLRGKADLTAHNFRTLRGTELALKYLPDAAKKVEALKKKVPKGKRLADKEIDKAFLEAMQKVGKALGHIRRNAAGEEESTANTSIAYYCSPAVMVDWYKEVGKAPLSAVLRSAAAAKVEV